MRNRVVDVYKGIAACMVVFIHAIFPGDFGGLIKAFATFAVPFFFCVSGYFAYNPDNSAVVKKTPKKIAHVVKIILLLYGVNIVRLFIKHSFDISAVLKVFTDAFNVKNMLLFLLFNITTISGIAWFLFALLYVYIINMLIAKLNLYKAAYTVSGFLLFIFIFLSEFQGFFGLNIPLPVRNFLFDGLPFFMIGNAINRYKDILSVKLTKTLTPPPNIYTSLHNMCRILCV